MLRILNIVLLLFLNSLIFAQKESDIWYFGNKAGIDFNNPTPVALSNGQMDTWEGCSSISSNEGDLLFYTNGINVWNKNHIVMPNGSGLLSHESSSQGAIIVKKPGINSIYFIFTTDATENNLSNGLRYSEVNMSLQGGLGDVNSNKNILITNSVCEKLVAIKHQNNFDFWIVTHLFGSNTFHSYLLTSNGLNTTPIVSNVGFSVIGSYDKSIGYLKANLVGNRIASANERSDNFELFDFNNSTGLINNPITFTNFSLLGGPYGIEFSPNGDLLYISEGYQSGYIYQYNLQAGSSSAIINSKLIVASFPSYGGTGALQLGPDNKIYHARFNKNSLGVINSPNIIGTLCNYVQNGFFLAGKSSRLGLPPMQKYINQFIYNGLCFGDSTSFNITTTYNIDSVSWNFGDINSGLSNTSMLLEPSHLFTNTGNFVVTLFLFSSNNIDTLSNIVTIITPPTINLGNDTILCQGESMFLGETNLNITYLWQDNSTNPTFNVTQQGIYWVEVSVDNCSAKDTINIGYNPLPIINLTNDTTLCQGDTFSIEATTPNATYLWQNNSTNSTFNVYQEGNYWVEVTVNNCTVKDTININYLTPFDLGNDTNICQGENILLKGTIPNTTYLWQDGTTNPTFTVVQQGTYWVQTTNQCGILSDSITISIEDCNIILTLPNIITPNKDGFNDLFSPMEKKGIKSINTQIYNRWGQLIFTSDFIEIGWDGRTTADALCPDGTYYWIIKYIDKNNKKFVLTGYVTLIK